MKRALDIEGRGPGVTSGGAAGRPGCNLTPHGHHPDRQIRRHRPSIAFYTGALDFVLQGRWPEIGDPAFATLARGEDRLYLSSHAGDGVFGQAVVVLAADIDGLFTTFRARGLDVSAKPDSPVHQGPLDQSWGTREFYVDDPDGNTLRFTRG